MNFDNPEPTYRMILEIVKALLEANVPQAAILTAIEKIEERTIIPDQERAQRNHAVFNALLNQSMSTVRSEG